MKKPVKLSPQETRVLAQLKITKSSSVKALYLLLHGATKKDHRVMQRHVGMVIYRINQKQVKFSIEPGEPRTYVLRRR